MLFTRLRAKVRLGIFAVAGLGYSAVPDGLMSDAAIADAVEAHVGQAQAGWRRRGQLRVVAGWRRSRPGWTDAEAAASGH